MGTASLPLYERLSVCSCISVRRVSMPVTQLSAVTVFSCVASRNKRDRRAFDGTDWELRTRDYICFLNSDFGGTEPHGPPRASAATEEVHCGTSATVHITGTQRAISFTPYICTSPSKNYFPTIRPIELPVFSCVASRNKRTACPRWARGWNYPIRTLDLPPAVRRTARAGRLPSGGPQTHCVRCVPPGHPTRTILPATSSAYSFSARIALAEDGDSNRNRAIRS